MVDFATPGTAPVLGKPTATPIEGSAAAGTVPRDEILEAMHRESNARAIDQIDRVTSGELKVGAGHYAAIRSLLVTAGRNAINAKGWEQTRFAAGVNAEVFMAERNFLSAQLEREMGIQSNYASFMSSFGNLFETFRELKKRNGLVPTKAEPFTGPTTSASPEVIPTQNFRTDPGLLREAGRMVRTTGQGPLSANDSMVPNHTLQTTGDPSATAPGTGGSSTPSATPPASAAGGGSATNLPAPGSSVPPTPGQPKGIVTADNLVKFQAAIWEFYKLWLNVEKLEFDTDNKIEQIKSGVETQKRTVAGVVGQMIENTEVERIKSDGQVWAGFNQYMAETKRWHYIADLNMSFGYVLGALGLNFTPFGPGSLPMDFNQAAISGRGDVWTKGPDGKWEKSVDFRNMLISAYGEKGVMKERIDELFAEIMKTYQPIFDNFNNRPKEFDFLPGMMDELPKMAKEFADWAGVPVSTPREALDALNGLLPEWMQMPVADRDRWNGYLRARPNGGSLLSDKENSPAAILGKKGLTVNPAYSSAPGPVK